MKNILLYGQPGSGKSTLAKLLALRLRHTIVIEGDELRKHSGNVDYTKQGRAANIELAITIALFLNSQHVNVVLAIVAPYEYLREKIEERLPGLKRCYLFYDSNITTRGREGFWVEDFELNGDYSINTLMGVNECLDNLYNQVMK